MEQPDAAPRRAREPRPRRPPPKERHGYYITPTRDFTKYTRDYEEKYWTREGALAWDQDVVSNLRCHVDALGAAEFTRLARSSLPVLLDEIDFQLYEARSTGIPASRDAMKAIAECVPAGLAGNIEEALHLQQPLEHLEEPLARLRDRIAILEGEQVDLEEQIRLDLFRDGSEVRRIRDGAERRSQKEELERLRSEMATTREELSRAVVDSRSERTRIQGELASALTAIAPKVAHDLEKTARLVENALQGERVPHAGPQGKELRDLVFKRQFRGLKDITNHALVVEQSAIAPLTMGIIHYRRRREIQEAMTTFVNDEAKHTAVFRRFMAEKLAAKERVPEHVIKGSDTYMWIARIMPSAAVFLAVIVETVGAAFLDFFGREEHMPEPLFRSICRTIAENDERRHLDLCADTYNELYRTGSRWERWRNRHALDQMMKKAYGDKDLDHPILQACRSFGIPPLDLYTWIAEALSRELARVGVYVSPEGFMHLFPAGATDPNEARA